MVVVMVVDTVDVTVNMVGVATIVGEAGKLGVATTFAKLCTVAVETRLVVMDGELDWAVAVNRIYHFQ